MVESKEINRQFEVTDKGIYKLEYYSPTVFVRKEVMSKEAFIEAYYKYILKLNDKKDGE